MDTSSLKKKCPRCGTEIEPKRHATAGDQAEKDGVKDSFHNKDYGRISMQISQTEV